MTRQLIRDDGVIFTWAENLAAKKNFREYTGEEVNIEPVPEVEKQIELPYLQPEEHVQTPSAAPKKRGPRAKDKS